MPLNYRIAIQTDDMRFYHKLSKLFEGSPLKVKFFALNQTIPSQKYDLIITNHKSINHSSGSQILQLQLNQIQHYLVTKIIGIVARKEIPKFKLLIVKNYRVLLKRNQNINYFRNQEFVLYQKYFGLYRKLYLLVASISCNIINYIY